MVIWQRINRVLQRVEDKGFKFANKAHFIAINTILVMIGYNFITFFVDYNEFYLEARVYFM
ncbi:hypothetical protein pb186bvf_004029 [Paramecium bursaria]